MYGIVRRRIFLIEDGDDDLEEAELGGDDASRLGQPRSLSGWFCSSRLARETEPSSGFRNRNRFKFLSLLFFLALRTSLGPAIRGEPGEFPFRGLPMLQGRVSKRIGDCGLVVAKHFKFGKLTVPFRFAWLLDSSVRSHL